MNAGVNTRTVLSGRPNALVRRIGVGNAANIMKKKLLPVIFLSLAWALFGSGCNTTKGFGKDVEKAGDKIQDAAK